jgi:hypothetical protein
VPKTSSNSVPPLIKSHSPEHSVPCSQQANSPQNTQAHSQYNSAQQIPQCIEISAHGKMQWFSANTTGSAIQSAASIPVEWCAHPPLPVPYSSLPTHAITPQPPPSSVLRPPLIFYRLGISGLSLSAYATLGIPIFISFFIDLLNLCHRSLNVIFSQIIIT